MSFTLSLLTANVYSPKKYKACICFHIIDDLLFCFFLCEHVLHMFTDAEESQCVTVPASILMNIGVSLNILAMFLSPLQVFRSQQIPTGPSQLRQGHEVRPRLPLPSPLHSPGHAKRERKRCQPQVSGIRSALCQQTRENVRGKMKCMQTRVKDLRGRNFKREMEKSVKIDVKTAQSTGGCKVRNGLTERLKRGNWWQVAVKQREKKQKSVLAV